MTKISIGSDHGGFNLKSALKAYLRTRKFDVTDEGAMSRGSCDYPDYALKVAESVAAGRADFGILICKTGIGMSIAANKVPGVRAALCRDEKSAELSREHNDANVLALAAETPEDEALKIVEAWLKSGFEGGGTSARHRRRVDKIHEIEKKYQCPP